MEDKGPFDRDAPSDSFRPRDRAAVVVIAIGIMLGLVMLLLVLPPISIFDNDDGDGGEESVTGDFVEDMPAPPEGFEAVSELLELNATEPVGEDARPRLTVSLAVPVSAGELIVLYSYVGDDWERLGEALPVAEGTAVQAEVTFLPENVAAFRPVEQARMILGELPPGTGLDAEAAGELTTLNVGGLRPGADGSVIGGTPLGDLGVPVAPAVGATSSSVIDTLNAVLADPALRDAHVGALVNLANSSAYTGIDLNYQSIDSSLSNDYTTFIQDLAGELSQDGRTLTITLPVPVQDGGGWNTFGFDWEALGAAVTAIKIAPVVEQDRYFADTEAALGYVTSQVPSNKLLLMINPYSHERGVEGVQSFTLTEALALASTPTTRPEGSIETNETLVALGLNLSGETGASGLVWDDTARAVTFSYTGAGGARLVWLTNSFSEAFKLDLARRFQLGGVAVSDVSEAPADANLWPLLTQYAQTGAVDLVKPNGAMLTPRWETSGGELESTSGPVVTWRAPDETGTFTLTLIVSDGVAQVGQEIDVPVTAAQAVAP